MNIETLKENLKAALAKIEELEDTIADQELKIDDLEQDAERAADHLYDDGCECEKYDYEPDELFCFLQDIGLNPFNLPQSLGDRMAIRDAITQHA